MLTQLLLAAGWLHIELGQWAQAEAMLGEAAQLIDGGVAKMRGQLAMRRAQLSLGRTDVQSARKYIESALELMGYGTGKPERSLSKALVVAANIALKQGLAADAEKFASDALAISEAIARGPETSADVGEALLRLANAKLELGAAKQAGSLLERSVRCLTNGLNIDHPLTQEAQAALAKLSP